MDIGKLLNKAKEFTVDEAIKRGNNRQMSKSGTGTHSPRSFGVGNATPPTMRMAGGVGMQKLVNTLVHRGINQFVMPKVDEALQGLAEGIRTSNRNKAHAAKGGKFMHDPSVLM